MNQITITYRLAGAAPRIITIDGDEHDALDVAEACRRRIFPGVDATLPDAGWDRALAIARAHKNAMARPAVKVEASPSLEASGAAAAAPGGVRETSRDALHKHQASGKLNAQQRRLVEFLRANTGRDWTRQELARALGWGINVICARVNELLHEPFNALQETRRRTCAVTGENVMALEAA